MQHHTTLTQSFSNLISDYLAEDNNLSECYQFAPTYNGVKEAYQARKNIDVDRETLVEVLLEQTKSSKFAGDAVLKNIERIRNGAMTVTTGHQLCLYGGPLFFFHKILSAISLAKRLSEDGLDTVPVYWMASEDHDFDEINHVFIGNQKVSWDKTAAGPVGRMMLEGMQDFKSELRRLIGADPVAQEELDKLDQIYSESSNLAEATRALVDSVFAHFGVLVLDADHVKLKSQLKEIIKKDINTQFSAGALEKANEFFARHDYNVQVEGREINFFLIEDDYRERIIRHEDAFATADGAYIWSQNELEQLIEKHPEKFSPNVVLRPVYQEVILPNVAYIGGPGELSYWLQLKGVFDTVNVFYPAVLLRDMVALITDKTQKRLLQTSTKLEELSIPFQELFKAKVREKGSHEYLVDRLEDSFQEDLNSLIDLLSKLGPDLAQSASAEQQKILNRLEVLKKKVLRKDKRLNTDLERQLMEVFENVKPQGVPQERFHNWLNYTSSPAKMVTELLPFYDLFKPGVKLIEL